MASDGYLHGYQNYDIDMMDSDSTALARERAKLPKLSESPSKALPAKPQMTTETPATQLGTLYQQFDSPAPSSSALYAMQLDPVSSADEGSSALYSTAAGLYTQALEHNNMYLLREEPSNSHSFDPKPVFPSNPALGSSSSPIPSQPSYLEAAGHYSDSRALQNSGGYSTAIGRSYLPYSGVVPSDASNGYISAYSPSHAVNENDSAYSMGAYLSEVDPSCLNKTTTAASPKVFTEAVKTKNVEGDAESNSFEQFIAECDARLLKEALLRFAGKVNDKSQVDEKLSLQSLLTEYKLLPKLPPLSKPTSKEEVDLKSNLQKSGFQGSSDPAMASIGNRNWNKEFQEIRDVLMAFGENRNVLRDPTQPDQEVRVQLDRLTRLQDDFYYAAKTYARIIISELSLPDCQKTIPPVNIGGVAGGAKYIMKGIMFKFALDQMIADKPKPVWMYGGNERNDRLAIKAAGKEFGALQIFIAMEVGLLRFPLQAMIDYKGYRLIAQVLLPIDKSTIVYGSNDSGRTVHTDVPEVNKLMEDLAKRMNLRGHKVGTHPSTSKMIYGPGDIEVHKGLDGHYYALDFGRLIPPEAPVTDPEVVAFERRSVFYKFLRFEHLLIECKVPLSSDSFSAWSMCDENRLENENNLRETCQKLYHSIIPEFAAELDKIDLRIRPDATPAAYTDHLLTRVRLPARVRYYGINIRHLGRIRRHMTSPEHRKLVMSHCVARVVKRVLRDEMRIQMENMMGTPTEGPFRLLVTQVFNMVLGRAGEKSLTFWKHDVKEFLKRMFYYVLDEKEANVEYDLRESVDMKALIIYALHGADVVLTPRALEELMQSIDNFVMIESDVQELVPRVRQLYKSFMFNAMHKRLLALETSNRNTAMRLLTASYNTAVLATLTVPKCPITNLELAFILYCILSIQLDEHQAVARMNSSEALREEIEKGFETAFLRSEESIGTLTSASNINHWSRMALLFAKWKRSLGDPALAEQYEEKSRDVTRLGANFSQGLTCSGAIADSETTFRWRALGERLTSFRLSQVPSTPNTPFKPAFITKAKPANYSKLAIASFRGFTPIVSVNE